MYYIQNNSIVADRYSTAPKYLTDSVPSLPNSNINIKDITTISIPNSSTYSDLSALENSIVFGYDRYIYNKIQYKPIFTLYNKFYQN